MKKSILPCAISFPWAAVLINIPQSNGRQFVRHLEKQISRKKIFSFYSFRFHDIWDFWGTLYFMKVRYFTNLKLCEVPNRIFVWLVFLWDMLWYRIWRSAEESVVTSSDKPQRTDDIHKFNFTTIKQIFRKFCAWNLRS
jgi:hypothetical protein